MSPFLKYLHLKTVVVASLVSVVLYGGLGKELLGPPSLYVGTRELWGVKVVRHSADHITLLSIKTLTNIRALTSFSLCVTQHPVELFHTCTQMYL